MNHMRLLRHFVNFVLVFDLVLIAGGFYLRFWPVNAVQVHGVDKILNAGKQVRPGERLVYKIDYCKNTDKQAVISRTLIGSTSYPLAPTTNNIPKGCSTAISSSTIIPQGTVPGFYHLRLTATYQLNFLHQVDVKSESESFEVLPADPNALLPCLPSLGNVLKTTGQSVPQAAGTSSDLTPPDSGILPSASTAATPAPSTSQAVPSPNLLSRVVRSITDLIGK